MSKDFCLSSKIEELKSRFDKKKDTTKLWVIDEFEGYVKDFIQKEAKLISKLVGEEIDFKDFCYERAKLLGDALIHSPQEKGDVHDRVSEDTPDDVSVINCRSSGTHSQQGCGKIFCNHRIKCIGCSVCGKPNLCPECAGSSNPAYTNQDRRQPDMKEGVYTRGAVCECRHTHQFHILGDCDKCDCKGFRYTKERMGRPWKQKGSDKTDCTNSEEKDEIKR